MHRFHRDSNEANIPRAKLSFYFFNYHWTYMSKRCQKKDDRYCFLLETTLRTSKYNAYLVLLSYKTEMQIADGIVHRSTRNLISHQTGFILTIKNKRFQVLLRSKFSHQILKELTPNLELKAEWLPRWLRDHYSRFFQAVKSKVGITTYR